MPTWTTTAKVTRYLPTNYATYLTTSLANLIDQASEITYGDLSPRYWAFPDATDTPDTPEIIQVTVAYLAAHLARLELGRANEIELVAEGTANNLLALYHDRIQRLKAEDAAERIQVPLETISGEPLVLGTSPYASYQHIFAPGTDVEGTWTPVGLEGFEVLPESVVVSGYKQGSDYAAKFYPEFRAWMFDRYNGALVDDVQITSYQIDYLKRREISKPETRYGIELVRG